MLKDDPVQKFQMRVAHVGINAKGDKEAYQFAEQFFQLLGLPVEETMVSYFNGSLIEVMKENGRGSNGHIGLAVNNCEEAMQYFMKRGMHCVEETKKYDEQGKCVFVYFEGEVGGFAIHLIQE